jgi:pyruvate dehydrogenase E2 component (dihydrolipoamide acetyltransferase)
MFEFKLPSLGADMDEGKLIEWKVKPGDAVKRGQVVAVVDTSKAAVDVEIWEDGVVSELITQPGETIPVGTVMARLNGAAPAPAAPAQPAAPPVPGRQRVSPAARKVAQEKGVDLERIAGTGPHGAITVEDVENAALATREPKAKERRIEPGVPDRNREMRKAIASAMSRSKREIPHYYLSQTIPMQRASEWLAAENAKRPVTARLLMAVLQLKAVALALTGFPDLNGFFRDGAYQPVAAVHAGVAISLRQGGLVAPAIHDVAQLLCAARAPARCAPPRCPTRPSPSAISAKAASNPSTRSSILRRSRSSASARSRRGHGCRPTAGCTWRRRWSRALARTTG